MRGQADVGGTSPTIMSEFANLHNSNSHTNKASSKSMDANRHISSPDLGRLHTHQMRAERGGIRSAESERGNGGALAGLAPGSCLLRGIKGIRGIEGVPFASLVRVNSARCLLSLPLAVGVGVRCTAVCRCCDKTRGVRGRSGKRTASKQVRNVRVGLKTFLHKYYCRKHHE